MKKTFLLSAAIASAFAFASASQPWEFVYKRLKGDFVVFGGFLGDTYAPTADDKKIAFSVTGEAAKEMFDAMGPDVKDTCGTEDGGRVRNKEAVSCRYRKKTGYVCDFGFDLRTGKAINGSVC